MAQRKPEPIDARALGLCAGIAIAIATLHAMPLRLSRAGRDDSRAQPTTPVPVPGNSPVRFAALPLRAEDDDPAGASLAALPVADVRRVSAPSGTSLAAPARPEALSTRDRRLAAAPKRGPPAPDRSEG
jgi:hypothetical protein